MKKKNPVVRPELLYRARARGLVLEEHVRRWFEETWPSFYRPPANHKRWSMNCPHDFRLQLAENTVLNVDITGPPLNGDWTAPPQKRVTDVHLLCHIEMDSCVWEGVLRGEDFHGSIVPETSASPIRFCVWLNCLKDGIDYKAVAAAAAR